MWKFVIISILAFTKVNTVLATIEQELKDQLMMSIVESKNRAFDQILALQSLAVPKPGKFIEIVNEMVKNSHHDMEILKKESGVVNDATCNEIDTIDANALKTIEHYQNCIEKVIENVDADMSYLASDGNLLMKEIEYASADIVEQLQNQVAELETRSYQFGKYVKKLEKCDTQSNLPRLKRQISEALTRYKQCLQ